MMNYFLHDQPAHKKLSVTWLQLPVYSNLVTASRLQLPGYSCMVTITWLHFTVAFVTAL